MPDDKAQNASKSQASIKPGGNPATEKISEVDAEIHQRINDPRLLLDRHIEEEVGKRVGKIFKPFYYIIPILGFLSAAIGVLLGFIGVDVAKKYISQKVDENTSPAIIEQVTNTLNRITGQAKVRAAEIELHYSSSVSLHSSFTNDAAKFLKTITDYNLQVIQSGDEYLTKLLTLRTNGEVVVLAELINLFSTQIVTNLVKGSMPLTLPSRGMDGRRNSFSQIESKSYIKLADFPVPETVRIRHRQLNSTNDTLIPTADLFNGLKDDKLWLYGVWGDQINRAMTNVNTISIEVEYIKKPRFNPNPFSPSSGRTPKMPDI